MTRKTLYRVTWREWQTTVACDNYEAAVRAAAEFWKADYMIVRKDCQVSEICTVLAD